MLILPLPTKIVWGLDFYINHTKIQQIYLNLLNKKLIIL